MVEENNIKKEFEVYNKKNELLYIVDNNISEILKEFYALKEIQFITDNFEELILQDVFANDKETTIKIMRDITPLFKDWFYNKFKAKENVSISTRGNTRSGKSVSVLAIVDLACEFYQKPFDTEYIICGNQKEYRLKLKDAEFGDFFQIDENAFANVGLGSNTEMLQLKDIQNIIAKQNIHTAYITPRTFLSNNSIIGIATWGKDTTNWLNRFLVYDLRSSATQLLGHIIIDVGKLFRKYGCFIYKHLGGCTNPNKLMFNKFENQNIIFTSYKVPTKPEIVTFHKDFLNYSKCIPEQFRNEPNLALETFNENQNKQMPCPFYNVCHHPMCRYEHKKDTWIEKEMKGGFDERTEERFRTATKLFSKLAMFDLEKGKMIMSAKNKDNLKLKVKLKLDEVTSTKYTGTEFEEIIDTLLSLTEPDFLKSVLVKLEVDEKEYLSSIKTSNPELNYFDLIMEMNDEKLSEEPKKEIKKKSKSEKKDNEIGNTQLKEIEEE